MAVPWQIMPGLTGKVFSPDTQEQSGKKHACSDCFSCQHCGEERCAICRDHRATSGPKKPSTGSCCFRASTEEV